MSDKSSGTTTTALEFLGTGWAFPPSFGPGGADVEMVSDADDIHQALQILFATRLGERPMQEGFGCSLDEFLFAEVDHGLVNRIVGMIDDAILRHEPRIRLLDLDVSRDPLTTGMLRIGIDYQILASNSRFNMVFPFYLDEARAPGA